MKIFRFIPLLAFFILISSLALQSCSKTDKPVVTVDSTKVTSPNQPVPAASGLTLNDKAKKGQLIYYKKY